MSLYETWLFYLPATMVTFVLYVLWLVFGQESVLPIDLGKKLNGKRLVGSGRGLWALPTALLVGITCVIVQGRGLDAVVLALGAEFGCVVNSLCKRRLGLQRGERFLPAGHLDFVVGALLFYALQFQLSWQVFVQGLLICGLSHYLASHLIRGQLKGLEP